MSDSAHRPNPDPPAGPRPDEQRLVLVRDTLPDTLPIIPINTRPVFPKMIVPMILEDPRARRVVDQLAKTGSKYVGLVLTRPAPGPAEPAAPASGAGPRGSAPAAASKPAGVPDAGPALYSVGVVAELLRAGQAAPDAPLQALFGVMERFRLESLLRAEPVPIARVRYLFEPDMEVNEELKAYASAVLSAIKELVKLNPLFKDELNLFLSRANLNDPGRLADFSAAMTTASPAELQEVLETLSIRQRMEKALVLLKKELDVSKIQARITRQIEEKLSRQQRDFFLREQLKAIKKELGLAKEGKEAEIEQFRERLKTLAPSPEAAARIEDELGKLALLEPASPEFGVSRHYLDWLTSLPWGRTTPENYNLKQAAARLNRDHYGLEDVKDRILEFLSVGILKGRVSGSILCFVGPPGVGKTSLGRSIAGAIGRRFYRFSLGGMRDEAEIKGHRRTYIGALPGKFIQAMKLCQSQNPLIMLDEVDKIGASFQGDPASALLEALDPEQNREFLDHYLDVRFDLSNVLFVCTANVLDTIPRPLLDRLELIKLAGYIPEEKLQIARRFLLPRQLEANGLTDRRLRLTRRAVRELIDGYAREPGVRGLEQAIRKICRKAARRLVAKTLTRATLDAADLPDWLGPRVHAGRDPFRRPGPGVVMGLAWTQMGGETLYIEAARVAADTPGFKQTGQLGSVMVESSEIAYTFVRAFLNDRPGAREFFARHFIHLHVPSGATPKDGPSAGLTMACALYSLALGTPIRAGWAMTGELTLTGRVMPVGGIREKTIAAKRAGVRNLIFPFDNARDFEELPAHVRRGLKPHFIAEFRDVLPLCFPGDRARPGGRRPGEKNA